MSATDERTTAPYSADNQNPANFTTVELPIISVAPGTTGAYVHDQVPGRKMDRLLVGVSWFVGGLACAAAAVWFSGIAETDKTVSPAPRYAEANTSTTTTSTLLMAVTPRGTTPETAVIPRTPATTDAPQVSSTTTSMAPASLPVISRIPAEAQQLLSDALALAEAARQRVSPSTTATTQPSSSPAVIPRN